MSEQVELDRSVLSLPWVVAPDKQRPVEVVPVVARKRDFTQGEALVIMLALFVLEVLVGSMVFLTTGDTGVVVFGVVALIANCLIMIRMPVEGSEDTAPACTPSRITFTGRPD